MEKSERLRKATTINKPPRLLVVTNSLEQDAPTRLAIAVVETAQRSGRYDAAVFAMSRGGAMSNTLFERGMRFAAGGALAGMPRLRSLIGDFQPDIVHFHLARPALLGLPVALAARVPVSVVTHHGAHEWDEKGRMVGMAMRHAYPAVASRADCIVAVSEASRAELVEHGLAGGQVIVIPNGVDTKRFAPLVSRQRAEVRNRYFPNEVGAPLLVVGCAGNLRQIKGHEVLVRAAAEVCEQVAEARFIVWGDGPEHGRLRQQLEELNLGDKFILAGRTASLPNELGVCDVFVQPSLRESFGLAAAEAMTCAVPVVLSRVGGLQEVGGDAAVFVPSGNADALAAELIKLLADAKRRRKLGLAGRNRILTKFSLERMCQAHLDLYGRLLQERTN